MGFWDWAFVLGCLSLSGLGIYLYTRHFKKRRRVIPYSVQAEIDQTPEWWDNEFRKLQGLPSALVPETDMERWRAAGITEVWDGDFHFSFKNLTDPKPPTPTEIWTPGPNDRYDLSVDLSIMSSTIQEAMKEGKNE